MKCPVGAMEGQEQITNLQMEIKNIHNKLKSETAEKEKIQREYIEKENTIQKLRKEKNLLKDKYEKFQKDSERPLPTNGIIWITLGATTLISLMVFFSFKNVKGSSIDPNLKVSKI